MNYSLCVWTFYPLSRMRGSISLALQINLWSILTNQNIQKPPGSNPFSTAVWMANWTNITHIVGDYSTAVTVYINSEVLKECRKIDMGDYAGVSNPTHMKHLTLLKAIKRLWMCNMTYFHAKYINYSSWWRSVFLAGNSCSIQPVAVS